MSDNAPEAIEPDEANQVARPENFLQRLEALEAHVFPKKEEPAEEESAPVDDVATVPVDTAPAVDTSGEGHASY